MRNPVFPILLAAFMVLHSMNLSPQMPVSPGETLMPAITETQAAEITLYREEDGPYRVTAVETYVLKGAGPRDIPLRLTFPAGGGPFPVIIFSHGATGTRNLYQPLITHWASHGYVCIQPDHADAGKMPGEPSPFTNWKERPREIAFIIDSLEKIGRDIPGLGLQMNHRVIGIGGHSFGAHTAQLVAGTTTAFNEQRETQQDRRPQAFLLISPQGTGPGGGLDHLSWQEVTRPFLVITGTNDFGRKGNDWSWRTEPYRYAPSAEKYLVVIEDAYHGFGGVVGAAYSGRGSGPDNPDHRRYVKSSAMAFWDAYLKDEAEARTFLRSGQLETMSGRKVTMSFPGEGGNDRKMNAEKPTLHESQYEDLTWRDPSRSRAIPIRVYAPRDRKGSLPLVIFSHGGGESRDAFGYLGSYWASHGYLAVFVEHPGSNRKAVDAKGLQALSTSADFPDRPADMRFVLDRILKDDHGCPLLQGRVDPGRIGAAGQCAGSSTAMALAGLQVRLPGVSAQGFRDTRIRAVIALSPQVPAGPVLGEVLHQNSWAHITLPALVVTGTKDFAWLPDVRRDPDLIRKAYDSMPPGERYLVEIQDAEHQAFTDSEPYYPARQRDPRHHGWIQRATTLFLDAFLKDDRHALSRLREKELEKSTGRECRQECRMDNPSGDTNNSRTESIPAPPARDYNATSGRKRPLSPSGEKKTALQAEKMFSYLDRDRNGSLSGEELPERLRPILERLDRDHNGSLSKSELSQGLERTRARQGVQQQRQQKGQQAPVAGGKCRDLKLGDLTVRVTWPEQGGSHPVLLFSHHVGGARCDYQPLIRHWADEGFVCLQADHADSRTHHAPETGLDGKKRARELSFLIDSLATVEKEIPELKGRIDQSRIGAGGHLIGAYAVSLLAGLKVFGGGEAGEPLIDRRVGAILLLSPQGRGEGRTEQSWKDIRIPMMVLTGTETVSRRTGNPAAWRTEPYRYASPGSKYLVSLQGIDNTYGGIVGGAEMKEPETGWILEVTLDFWSAHLKNESAASRRLESKTLENASRGGVVMSIK